MSNSELDDGKKAEAIKALVGKSFVPTAKFNAEKQNVKAQEDAYNALKTEFETFKQSKMTEEEKKVAQEKELQENYKKANLMVSRFQAENIFAKSGLKEEDYSGILDSIVTEDADKTKVLAQAICGSIQKQKEAIEKEITDKIMKNTPNPTAGNGTSTVNKKEELQKLLDEAVKKNDFVKMASYTRQIQQIKE